MTHFQQTAQMSECTAMLLPTFVIVIPAMDGFTMGLHALKVIITLLLSIPNILLQSLFRIHSPVYFFEHSRQYLNSKNTSEM